MFQFPEFASYTYVFSARYPYGWVSPFGNSRIKARLPLPETYRSLATSFIASYRQGIHQTPFSRLIRASERATAFESAPRRAFARFGASLEPAPRRAFARSGAWLNRSPRDALPCHCACPHIPGLSSHRAYARSVSALDLERLLLVSDRFAACGQGLPAHSSNSGDIGKAPLGQAAKSVSCFSLFTMSKPKSRSSKGPNE